MLDYLFSLQWLVGDVLTTVDGDQAYGVSALRFSSGSCISSLNLWRLLRNGSISCTSEDHNQMFGLPEPFDAIAELRELEGQRVEAASVREVTVDLTLQFSSGLSLEVIYTCTGYEGWSATSPEHGTVFVGCGGELVGYGP